MIKQLSVVLTCIVCLHGLKTFSQSPNLPVKGNLDQTLLTNRTFSNAVQTDTVMKQVAIPANYTLEVKAKVNAAIGRGLDLEARNAGLKGWRLSLDAANLKTSSTLSTARAMTLSRSNEEHTIRVAVQNDSAYIYQNGAYIETQALASIKNIADGVEINSLPYADSNSLIANWAGTAPNNTGRPSDYGWSYTGTTVTNLFNTANSTSGVRYLDINATSNTHTLDGNVYNGRILFIRWDNSATQNTVYNYPVTLEANTTYEFSMLHAYVSNATGSRTMTVGMGKTTSSADRIASHTFITSGTRVLTRENFSFTSQEAGIYYFTINGDWALFSIAGLAVRKVVTEPRFIFGKNYPAGGVDMEISSVTYEEGAYAPAAIITGPTQMVTVTGATASYLTSFNTNYVVNGKTDLHLTGERSPLVNSTVNLNANDAWLFIDNVKPSLMVANWLDKVRVNGVPAAGNPNVRIAMFKNGTVIIPNGNLTANEALMAYTEPGLAGNTKAFGTVTYHDSLGAFDNRIRSFKLHRGFMATLATNADGSGYSRVFIANDSDLVVHAMPAGLDSTVSFIRVFKWDWPSKKGWAGGGLPLSLTNSTWFYDWNIAGTPTVDYNYALIRHNAGWPAWSDINAKQNSNTLLGFNEPEQADQANMTVEQAIQQWPEMMKSGLRIGSPAPANPQGNWITNFLSKCDSLNYRVDFVAIHCYWNSRTPQQWYSGLKSIYDRVKRPLWITEWNNGANWTGEAWPADPVAQFEKQYNDIKGILQVLDTTSFVERYSIYNWVENKRAMVLADTLTKAGKYYAANKSELAFNPQQAYVHNWKLVAPFINSTINNDDYFLVTLSWKDLNGELGSKYILERKIDGRDTSFLPVKTDSTYVPGMDQSFIDSVYAKATYRIKVFSRDGSQFVYSGVYNVMRDAVAIPPSNLTGEVLSSDQIKLTWNAGTNVRSYNLKRAASQEGPFETILARTTQLSFLDSSLTPATTYYYMVTGLNSAGESISSTVLLLTTKVLVPPAGVQHPRIASGDNRITLSWDFMYDARYEIQRSAAANGPFAVIAGDVRAVRYIDTTVLNDQTWYYKIIAYNASGRGPETALLTGRPEFGQHLHITFNENTGKFTEDVWGAYHGSWVDTVAWIPGKDSATGAIALNRTASSFVQLPEGVVSKLNDFTMATWFKMPANQVNNTRLFDFGNDAGTFMVFVPRNSGNIRYKITCAAGTFDRFIPYTFPLNEWVHMAISQKGNVFKFYANGQLIFTDSNATIRPSDMGITRNNYLGKSQFPNDPYSDHMYDDLRIYSYGLSDKQINQLAHGIEPVRLLNVIVEHLNANGTSTTGNSIRPYLKLINKESIPLAYKELTVRYWFTAENYSGINTWIDYAALGNKVKAKYVMLPTPKSNALGYIEYSFDSSAGILPAAGNSGVIQSRANNANWGNFYESNDYSHTTNSTYTPNDKVTLYRNGKLIAGTEPDGVAEQLQVTVDYQNRSSAANSISAVIKVLNQGNIPVNYEDITLRYWFTTEDISPLNYWIDYAVLGASNITGAFTRLSQPRTGADAYLEFGFKPGILYPLCNTGNIQFRITKSDWSAFDQSNDYSYTGRITIYYKGALIHGVEPDSGLITSLFHY